MASRNFPTSLQSLAEVRSCKRGLFSRKHSLNNGAVLYFSEIKRFRELFEAATYFVEYNFLHLLLLHIKMMSETDENEI